MVDRAGAADVQQLLRDAGPAALGVLLRRGERFADAEDAMQDSLLVALDSWTARGVPDRPIGWLVRVAGRRLIDRHHQDSARRRRESLIASWSSLPDEPAASEDDSLAMLFLCCHDELNPSSAVPLTLRAVGGLTTREIADALLQPEATVAQRISRAKAVISRSGEPFRRPPPDLVDGRLPAVMQVIYLIFTEGHAATSGPRITRADLADEAIRLARLLHERLVDHPETSGLLALLLLTDARRSARVTTDGDLVPLDLQDRRLWNRAMIAEGLELLTAALAHHAMGDYQLQASVAAVHDQAPSYEATDWNQLRALYNVLLQRSDNPLVRLNRAVAVAHTDGPRAALRELDALAVTLAAHHRFHATAGYVHD
ncbi:MAG: polymerase sigma factor, partial [Ilumatobacteraceae bacterium]|nr:polymerase sigma factor [Ilumatobacteraceae bacterium]